MKKFCKFLTAALAVVALTACGDKDDKDKTPDIPVAPDEIPEAMLGEWKLTGWTGGSGIVGHIYLELRVDNTFALYEDITSHGFNMMTGSFTYDVAEETISGSYSDGKDWGSNYSVDMPNITTMRWAAIGTDDICIYTRVTIPFSLTATRVSPSEEYFPFL